MHLNGFYEISFCKEIVEIEALSLVNDECLELGIRFINGDILFYEIKNNKFISITIKKYKYFTDDEMYQLFVENSIFNIFKTLNNYIDLNV